MNTKLARLWRAAFARRIWRYFMHDATRRRLLEAKGSRSRIYLNTGPGKRWLVTDMEKLGLLESGTMRSKLTPLGRAVYQHGQSKRGVE